MGSNTPGCSLASPTFTACGQEPNHGRAAACQLRWLAGKVATEAGPSATAAVRSARTSQHACRLCTLLLAQGEELLRLALNDLAELGDQVLRIGVRRHARRKREARAIAHPSRWTLMSSGCNHGTAVVFVVSINKKITAVTRTEAR